MDDEAGQARPGGRERARVAVTAEPDGWSPEVEEAARKTRERHRHALSGRERLVGAPFGIALLAGVAAVAWLVDDARGFDAGLALAFLAAFVLAARVEFQTGAGYAVPTQLVVVPMLFALPAFAVPLVVGTGYVVSRALERPRPPLGPERVVGEFANAWYAVAPALVIVLAGAERPELDRWPVYLAALGAQLALDALTAALRAGLAFRAHPLELLRELRFAQRLDVVLAPLGFLAALEAADAPWSWLLVLPLMGLITTFGRERTVLIDNQLELARAYRGTALLLGEVVEGDDEYTGRHSRGVGSLALDVAEHMRLDARTRRDIEFGGLLHDVGKIALPKELVNKAGPLDAEEWAVMQTHTVQGQRMLQRIGGVLDDVGLIVRASHESWDGSGYPDGSAGEDIPLAARIIACCDAYSAMTTDRPYRAARTAAEAVVELRACAGTQFDPAVVDAVVAVLERQGEEPDAASAGPAAAVLDRLTVSLDRQLTPAAPVAEREVFGTGLRALIDALDDGIVVHDGEGRAQVCNPGAELVVGVRTADLAVALGTGDGALALVDEDCRPLPAAAHPWHVALRTGQPAGPAIVGFTRRDGQVRWASVTSRPLRRRGRPRAVVSSLADVTARRRLEAELRDLVDRDVVTGLVTRRRFEEDLARQLERTRRYGETAAVVAVELDGLPAVDDVCGRATGDAVLAAAARAMRRALRASDLLGRTGDASFGVLLTHVSEEQAEAIAAKLCRVVAATPTRTPAGTVSVTAEARMRVVTASLPSTAGLLDPVPAPPAARRAAPA